MEKESKGFKDFSKLFGEDPTSGLDDFDNKLVTLISEVVRLNEGFLLRQNKTNSKNMKLLEKITDSLIKIADKLIILDGRITDIEYEIFESDEDTTPQGKEENCSNQ